MPPIDGSLRPSQVRAMATRVLIDHRTARHPEKAARPDNPIQRKPDWIRVRAPNHPVVS